MNKMKVEFAIREQILHRGYIGIDDMMRTAMSQNMSSYYKIKQPLGEKADFITSPEISQMFGEMIGIWCADIWYKLGQPTQFNILELGPGRGLLMRDLLRSTKNIIGFHEALSIQLLEINDQLIKIQKDQILPLHSRIEWISSFNKMNMMPSIVVANEFFDALPIKQYIKIKKEWHEVILTINPINQMLQFDHYDILNKSLQEHLSLAYMHAGDGAVLEESQESLKIIQLLTEHIKSYSGVVLVIDYGYDFLPSTRQNYQYISTLQAIQNHKFHPILKNLGEADLSAHVDFAAMRLAAEAHHGTVYGTVNQGDFLNNIGIKTRLNNLQIQNPDLAPILQKQYDRLASPQAMGNLFKILQIVPSQKIKPLL